MNVSAFLSGASLGLCAAFVPHAQRHARLMAAIAEARAPIAARDDITALRGDWMRIGSDFRSAYETLDRELQAGRR